MISTMNTYLPEAQFADEPVSDQSITVKKKIKLYVHAFYTNQINISVFI